MVLRTRCLYQHVGTPIHRTQWRRIPRRYYSSDAPNATPQSTDPEEAEWFQQLRTEMLNRELPLERSTIDDQFERKLEGTLHSFFPRSWKGTFSSERIPEGGMPGSIGNHLIFCNPAVPDASLLPDDGTDKLHSPGDPFVRRMWAGGTVRVDKDLYFDQDNGWVMGKPILCGERIKEVRLRGQGDNEKIFITIERKFARYGSVYEAVRKSKVPADNKVALNQLLQKQMRKWDQNFLTEDRNIVFLRERSSQELQDIKAGKMAPVKYLKCELLLLL
ncbi:hypothetical protein N0V90_001981 [Kalmusia sp. IMI 367209]|nr:hypothetical protein N0V90_001981 [Kalmusia sp. IMI 367209]